MEVSSINTQAQVQAPVVQQEAPARSRQPEPAEKASAEAKSNVQAREVQQAESSRRAQVVAEEIKKTDRMPKPEEVVESVLKINEWLNNRQVKVEFDKESGGNIARMVEKDSGEVIWQIPNEQVLNIARRIAQMQREDIRQAVSVRQHGALAGTLVQDKA